MKEENKKRCIDCLNYVVHRTVVNGKLFDCEYAFSLCIVSKRWRWPLTIEICKNFKIKNE
jgi:hypothetical protein